MASLRVGQRMKACWAVVADVDAAAAPRAVSRGGTSSCRGEGESESGSDGVKEEEEVVVVVGINDARV